MEISFQDFIQFVRKDMQISTSDLPDDADSLKISFEIAKEVVLRRIRCIAPHIYPLLVYNLAGAYLMEIATDTPPSTLFSDFRNNNGMNSFTPGVITNSSDNATSQSWAVPEFVKNLSPDDLQLLKTPWGQFYYRFANKIGPYRTLR